MPYNVYTVEYFGDPNHVALFVETGADRSGKLFHVKSDLVTGMEYIVRESVNPQDSASYMPGTLILIGSVDPANMTLFDETCASVEDPASQFNTRKQRRDPPKPLRRCGHWVNDAKRELFGRNIV